MISAYNIHNSFREVYVLSVRNCFWKQIAGKAVPIHNLNTRYDDVTQYEEDLNLTSISENERRSVCKSLNDMCNDSSDPDSHPGTPDAKGASSNLFSLFTKRFSDSATVQCDRLNHRPKTEAVEEEKVSTQYMEKAPSIWKIHTQYIVHTITVKVLITSRVN